MARQCLFCTNTANTNEHLWPDWILQSLKHKFSIVRSIDNKRVGKEFSGPVKVKCVCSECNHGWMSTLETKIAPYVRAMMHGVALSLGREQQEEISAWAVKIGMILEAVRHGRPNFYTTPEREALRLSETIPSRSLIWLGRLSTAALHVDGLDLSLTVDGVAKAAQGCVTTIVVGQLIIQVLTAHFPPHHNKIDSKIWCVAGPWQESLVGIWPTEPAAAWPPQLEFTLRGLLPFGVLFHRWRYGVRQVGLR